MSLSLPHFSKRVSFIRLFLVHFLVLDDDRNLYPISIRFPFVSRRLDSHSRFESLCTRAHSPRLPGDRRVLRRMHRSLHRLSNPHIMFCYARASLHIYPHHALRASAREGGSLLRRPSRVVLGRSSRERWDHSHAPLSWQLGIRVWCRRIKSCHGVWRVGFWLSIRAPRRVHPRLPRLLGNL